MDLDLDALGDVLSDRPVVCARPHEKFQPKAKPRQGKLTRDRRIDDGDLVSRRGYSVDASPEESCSLKLNSSSFSGVVPASDDNKFYHDVSMEPARSSSPRTCMDDIVLESLFPKSAEQQAGSLLLDSIPASDSLSSTHNYAPHDKLQPWAKARQRKADHTVSIAEMEKMPSLSSVISDHTQSERLMPHHEHKVQTQAILFEHLDSPDVLGTCSETVTIDEISSPTFPSVEGIDYSSFGVDDCAPMSPAILESSAVEGQAELEEFSLLNDSNIATLENVPEVAEIEKCQEFSRSGHVGNGSNPQRKQRKVAAVSTPTNSEILTTRCNFVGNMDGDDYDHEPECVPQRNQRSKKSRVEAKTDRPVRKCKRTAATQEQPAEQPSKKFSHSTRRTKRSVSKDLLLVPEDELDYRTLKIKDIILLANHRENLNKKKTKNGKSASINQSTNNWSYGEDYENGDDDFVSKQVGADLDDETVPRASCNPILFNNHSFMDKPPYSRWSSNETLLFFEAVRQFGTDLSLIQQLFPGRTRKQVWAKLKKEENQQPFKIYEAMGSHSKDHSYFLKVIEQLQQAAAPENDQQNADPIDPQMGEHASPSEKDDVPADGDEACEVENVLASPPKDKESEEEDLEFWCSYESVF